MTTATTRQAIRRELYNRIPGLAFTGTAASRTSTTLTHTQAFQDSTLGNNHYRGYYLYMPDDTAADQVRKIASHVASTGVVTTAGPAWGVTTDLDYEVVGLLHPDEINNAIIRALNRIYFETAVPLSPEITDGDMDANNTTSWTSVGTPNTKSKVTTAAKVFSGIRSLRVLNDTAGEGVQSTTVRGFSTNGNERVYVSAVVHCDVGTAELHLYNVTGSASIASVTSTEEGWAHLWLDVDSLPTGCEEIAVQMIGTQDTADLYWSHVVLYRMDRMQLALPTWCDDTWKLSRLREMRYGKNISNQSRGGYDDATSRVPHDWYQPSMFALEPYHLEANPYAVQLFRPLPRNELWVQGQRPWSDLETLSTDASTTLAPLELLYAYAKEELAKVLYKRYPSDARWLALLTEASAEVDAETRSRPTVPLAPVRIEYWGRV